jgi:uncharacterized RDD family membrane protein YckC
MSSQYDKQYTVVTPERVQLQFQTAGIGSRAIAHMVDNLLLALVNLVIILLLFFGSKWVGDSMALWVNDYGAAIIIILLVLLNVGYYIGLEYYNGGQTLGKKWFGIRVLQENGQAATFLSILIRNFFRLLDLLPSFYFIGTVVMIFSKRDKRIGDMVAGTIVVVEMQRDRLKRKRVVDRELQTWQMSLPDVMLPREAKALIEHKDWRLLAAYIDQLPNLTENKAIELSVPIAHHFMTKLSSAGAPKMTNQQTYLVWLFEQLREEWEY